MYENGERSTTNYESMYAARLLFFSCLFFFSAHDRTRRLNFFFLLRLLPLLATVASVGLKGVVTGDARD